MRERSMSAISAVGTRPIRVPRLDRRTVVILSIMAKLGWVMPVVVGIAMRVVGASAAVVVSGMTTMDSVASNRSSWMMSAGRGLAA